VSGPHFAERLGHVEILIQQAQHKGVRANAVENQDAAACLEIFAKEREAEWINNNAFVRLV
jgi:hypothetical protein